MERDQWKRQLTAESAWPWPCPACHAGRLRLEKPSVVIRETRESKEYRLGKEDGDFYRGDVTDRFCCLLVCNQPHCNEPVTVCGTTTHEEEMDGEGGRDWRVYLCPKFFHPALPIIRMPEATPEGRA